MNLALFDKIRGVQRRNPRAKVGWTIIRRKEEEGGMVELGVILLCYRVGLNARSTTILPFPHSQMNTYRVSNPLLRLVFLPILILSFDVQKRLKAIVLVLAGTQVPQAQL